MTPTYLLADAVLSPLPFVAAALWGLWRLQHGAFRARRRGAWVAAGSLALLLALCVPAIGNLLLASLEPPPLDAAAASTAQAIVILSAGRNSGAREWGGETGDAQTLERTRYGAYLSRMSGLPVLVTGGLPGGGVRTLAALMAESLQRDHGVRPRWVETAALTTAENARYSAPLLQAAGIRRVLLVTSAVHMRRALRAFRAAGLEPVAAPTDYMGRNGLRARDLVPSVQGLRRSQFALREWAGNLLYAVF